MSLFDKFFGAKETTGKTVDQSQPVDLTTAIQMHLKGEVDQALGAYLRICEEVPEDVVAPFMAAAIRAGKGEIAEAAERLRTLSQNIASRGDTISAAIVSEVATVAPGRMLPGVAAAAVSFGDALKQEGLVQEAAVCFEIGAGIVPDNANVLHKFGDTLHDLRMYEYAESVLQEALKHAPNHWGALYTYAVLLQDLQRDEEALQYYDKAVTFYPTHAKAQNNYGAALLRTNRLEAALEHCTIAAGLDPTSPLVQVNLGNIHMLMENYEQARSCFAEAVSLNDSLAAAYFGLARAEEILGTDPARVRELYRRAVQLDPALGNISPALKELASQA